MQNLYQSDELQRIKQTLMEALDTQEQKQYISKKKLLSLYLQSRRIGNQLISSSSTSKQSKTKKIQKLKVIQKYDQRITTTKQKNLIEESQQRIIECPICMDYLVHPVQTQCGHTFCEICLTEALLKQNICPMCKKVIPNFNFVSDDLLDGLVKQYVENNNDEHNDKYLQRRKKFFAWYKKRRPSTFEEGMQLDIRDLDNIWCEAEVKKIEKAPNNNEQFIFIHYKGWNSIYDEMLPSTSNRISSSGFFTKRKDIPQYRLNNQNNQNANDPNNGGAMQGVVLLGGEGQANLEGNIEDDELMEIDEDEFNQLQNKNNTKDSAKSSEESNIVQPANKIDAVKIFESIFKVNLNTFLTDKNHQ